MKRPNIGLKGAKPEHPHMGPHHKPVETPKVNKGAMEATAPHKHHGKTGIGHPEVSYKGANVKQGKFH